MPKIGGLWAGTDLPESSNAGSDVDLATVSTILAVDVQSLDGEGELCPPV
jgi:hypothetical protein